MNNRGLASFFDFSQIDISKLQEKTIETLYMTGISIIVVAILGLILGLLLFETSGRKGILSRLLYWLVAIFVNIFRSIPFIILIVLLIPFTKIILGSMSGVKGSLPALIISAAPFYARMVEIAFREVDKGVIEAAKAMGANRFPNNLESAITRKSASTCFWLNRYNHFFSGLHCNGGCYWSGRFRKFGVSRWLPTWSKYSYLSSNDLYLNYCLCDSMAWGYSR